MEARPGTRVAAARRVLRHDVQYIILIGAMTGLAIKEGKYTELEIQSIEEAIDSYCAVSTMAMPIGYNLKYVQNNSLSSDQLTGLIFKGRKGKGGSFWSEIGMSVGEASKSLMDLSI
jgi:hypothetical protein